MKIYLLNTSNDPYYYLPGQVAALTEEGLEKVKAYGLLKGTKALEEIEVDNIEFLGWELTANLADYTGAGGSFGKQGQFTVKRTFNTRENALEFLDKLGIFDGDFLATMAEKNEYKAATGARMVSMSGSLKPKVKIITAKNPNKRGT